MTMVFIVCALCALGVAFGTLTLVAMVVELIQGD